ncbi:unnamed protein product, partial [Hapterophycus canaliculatus]
RRSSSESAWYEEAEDTSALRGTKLKTINKDSKARETGREIRDTTISKRRGLLTTNWSSQAPRSAGPSALRRDLWNGGDDPGRYDTSGSSARRRDGELAGRAKNPS